MYRRLSAAIADRCAGGLHAGTVVKGLYLRWTLERVLARSPGVALDAGCGRHARFARLLGGRWPAWRFVGLDLHVAPEPGRAPNVFLCIGDLGALPLAGRLDLVYTVDVLEHVEDAEGALRALAGCLKAGGTLFVHVPATGERKFLPGVDHDYSWLGPPGPGDVHVWSGFERTRLEAWLRSAGLDVVQSRSTFGAPVTILKELYMLGEARRLPGVGLLLFPLLLVATWLEWRWGGRRGNGLLIVARRAER